MGSWERVGVAMLQLKVALNYRGQPKIVGTMKSIKWHLTATGVGHVQLYPLFCDPNSHHDSVLREEERLLIDSMEGIHPVHIDYKNRIREVSSVVETGGHLHKSGSTTNRIPFRSL